MPDELQQKIRAAISTAYYDARNHGRTMEDAADRATTAVMRLVGKPVSS
jgi:transcription elongation GreA/GreB family factor